MNLKRVHRLSHAEEMCVKKSFTSESKFELIEKDCCCDLAVMQFNLKNSIIKHSHCSSQTSSFPPGSGSAPQRTWPLDPGGRTPSPGQEMRRRDGGQRKIRADEFRE